MTLPTPPEFDDLGITPALQKNLTAAARAIRLAIAATDAAYQEAEVDSDADLRCDAAIKATRGGAGLRRVDAAGGALGATVNAHDSAAFGRRFRLGLRQRCRRRRVGCGMRRSDHWPGVVGAAGDDFSSSKALRASETSRANSCSFPAHIEDQNAGSA
jgi:hypothetical protein